MNEPLAVLPKLEVKAAVGCHYPCVPECTRKHFWDNEGEDK